MLIAGFLLSLFGWLFSIWRGIQVGLLCALLNFFFPPLSQLIFCLYEKKIRTPTLLMFLGWGLMLYGGWATVHGFMLQQMSGGGHGIAV